MKNVPATGLLMPAQRLAVSFTQILVAFTLIFSTINAGAQAVTEVITDYKGYWKSSAATPSAVKPDNAHNLLAFSYNGTQYSTGVNDDLLRHNGERFVRGDFWSLPVAGMTGTITSNTKVGLGALYDGVAGGASNPAPEWGINMYLTDGSKGLGLGTCVANLPVGSMSFSIDRIKPSSIGDGVPDVLITQVADPTGNSYDRYEFTDGAGNRIGFYKDIVFTNIAPVGNWTADFYDVVHSPMTLGAGFTQTDRPIRLWAADLSELGITSTNYQQVQNFKINLCGNSDVAFVAYNGSSIEFRQVLPVQYTSFTGTATHGKTLLSWQTAWEKDADRYVVERSSDARLFTAIDSVKAGNLSSLNDYRVTDRKAITGRSYYRLKQVDAKGGFTYSKTVLVESNGTQATLQVYPNPATGSVAVAHGQAVTGAQLVVRSVSGLAVKQQAVLNGAAQSNVALTGLTPGTYFICFENGNQQSTTTLFVR